MSDSIAGLFRLSLIIQKATPRDRFLKALTNVQEPLDPIYDMQHVGAKFPKLDCKENAWLQQKLATAITQRRQFFRYSRDHQERKSKPKTGLPSAEQSRTVRSGQIQADMLSQMHPESLGQTQASTLVLDRLDIARFNAYEADDGLSQTSFATSVDENNDHNKLRVPRLEDISGKSREFECPYCCVIIAPRNQKQWKYVSTQIRLRAAIICVLIRTGSMYLRTYDHTFVPRKTVIRSCSQTDAHGLTTNYQSTVVYTSVCSVNQQLSTPRKNCANMFLPVTARLPHQPLQRSYSRLPKKCHNVLLQPNAPFVMNGRTVLGSSILTYHQMT